MTKSLALRTLCYEDCVHGADFHLHLRKGKEISTVLTGGLRWFIAYGISGDGFLAGYFLSEAQNKRI